MKRDTVECRGRIGEIMGFLLLITFIWMDEYLHIPHFPHYLFRASLTRANLQECLFESFLVLFLGAVIIIRRKSLPHRTRSLSLATSCAWCRRLRRDGLWMSVEQYLEEDEKIKISHGMCPDCYEKTRQSLPQS